jgi:hypothetical protein
MDSPVLMLGDTPIDIQQKMKGSLKYKFLGLVWGLDFSPKPKRASIEKLLIYY